MTWQEVAALGTLSLVVVSGALPAVNPGALGCGRGQRYVSLVNAFWR